MKEFLTNWILPLLISAVIGAIGYQHISKVSLQKQVLRLQIQERVLNIAKLKIELSIYEEQERQANAVEF